MSYLGDVKAPETQHPTPTNICLSCVSSHILFSITMSAQYVLIRFQSFLIFGYLLHARAVLDFMNQFNYFALVILRSALSWQYIY